MKVISALKIMFYICLRKIRNSEDSVLKTQHKISCTKFLACNMQEIFNIYYLNMPNY